MKRDIKMQFLILLAAVSCVLVLPACGESQLPPEPEEGVLIYAALNPVDEKTEISVKKFNDAHEDVQIEIRDYSDEGGIERLRTELVLGRVPDIMEMHYYGKSGPKVAVGHKYYVVPGAYAESEDEYWMPYRQMAQKGYLEDLWPYIENDPELGRDALLEPPLKAAEVEGGLYIAFPSVMINTLVGAEGIVGDRTSWTLEELRSAFASMPSDSTILNYLYDRRDAFIYISGMSLDNYVDWETGRCSFDSEGFRSLAEFVKGFPEKSPLDEIDPTDYAAMMEINKESADRLHGGRQMLQQTMIGRLQDIQYLDSIFGGKAAFAGYPVEDGSVGSGFYISGRSLAMSSTCRNKEAAWDFLRQIFLPKGTCAQWGGIPINCSDYELSKKCSVSTTIGDASGYEYVIRAATKEEEQRYEDLINSIDKMELCDKAVFDIVQESLGPYFAGDRILDETVDLIQNRVSLYVNEQR